jgi:hypothetical protein
MYEYRYFAMRKHLDRLAAEQHRRDALASVGGHHDEVAAFRPGCINDRLVRTVILDLQGVAGDASGLRYASGDLKRFIGLGRNSRFVLSGRVLDRHCVDGACAIRTSDREERNAGSNRLGKATPCSTAFLASSEPSVGIRILLYIASSLLVRVQ